MSLADDLWAARDRFGVARVAELTRLDSVGVCVVSATRRDPVPPSNSVCSGAGSTLGLARFKALAEAVERWCGEGRELPAPEREPRAEPVDPDALILTDPRIPTYGWDTGHDVLTGEVRSVPAWAVRFPVAPPWPAAPSTTGLAFGESVDDAARRGLLECIERDAFSRACCLVVAGRGETMPLLAPEALGAEVADLALRVGAAGLRLTLRDITGDVRVPTIAATVWTTRADDAVVAHQGSACRPQPALAARDAVLEALQSRLVDIQGAREDLPAGVAPAPDPWFLGAGAEPSGSVPAPSAADLRALARLVAGPVIVVPMGPAEGPGAVVRVIVPGFETCAYDADRVGPRARRWLAG